MDAGDLKGLREGDVVTVPMAVKWPLRDGKIGLDRPDGTGAMFLEPDQVCGIQLVRLAVGDLVEHPAIDGDVAKIVHIEGDWVVTVWNGRPDVYRSAILTRASGRPE